MSGRKTIGSLLVRLGMDAKDADKSIKTFEKKLKEMGKRMESTGRMMSIGFTAPFLLGMGKAIKAYDEEAQVVRKLHTALGFTSTALLDQAAALQKVTVFADDQIITQQAWAASLGHSEGEISKMTSAAVGLASGLGIGLDQAMSMLHKTTMGATKGLGNLVPGVKDLTTEQLKSGAAIDLVNQKFQGYAEAAALTGAGPLKVLGNSFGDLTEQIGEAFLPIVVALSTKIQALITWFQALTPETKQAIVAWGALVASIGPLLIIIPKVIGVFKFLLSETGLIIAAIVLLAGSAAYVINNWDVLADSWKALWWGIKDMAINSINEVIAAINGMSTAFGAITGVKIGQIGMLDKADTSELKGNTQLNPFDKSDRRHSLWKPKQLQSFSEFTSDMASKGGKLIYSLLGGDDGLKQIDDATKLMDGLKGSIDRTGESAEGSGSKMSKMIGRFAEGSMGVGGAAKPDLSMLAGGAKGTSLPAGGFKVEDMDLGGMTTDIEHQNEVLENHKNTWASLGSAMGGAITEMGSAMMAGESFFASFAKAALHAAAAVVKAMLAQSLATAVAKSTETAGLPGLFIGIAAGIAGISLLEGLIGKIGTPKLAQGGLAYGPTNAIVGDNQNAHNDPEVISPLSKLKSIMGKSSAQAVEVVGVIRGDDIHLQTARAQSRAVRRGSANTIQF